MLVNVSIYGSSIDHHGYGNVRACEKVANDLGLGVSFSQVLQLPPSHTTSYSSYVLASIWQKGDDK